MMDVVLVYFYIIIVLTEQMGSSGTCNWIGTFKMCEKRSLSHGGLINYEELFLSFSSTNLNLQELDLIFQFIYWKKNLWKISDEQKCFDRNH